MFGHSIADRVTRTFLLVLTTVTISSSQAPQPSGQLSSAELSQAGNVVQAFCNSWKALKFDTVLTLLCNDIRTDTTQAPFLNSYGILTDNSARLGSFVLKEIQPNEGCVMVKTILMFTKTAPPVAVNGIHNFHLIKESGKWRVKTIVPPIAPPGPGGNGGGHPEE